MMLGDYLRLSNTSLFDAPHPVCRSLLEKQNTKTFSNNKSNVGVGISVPRTRPPVSGYTYTTSDTDQNNGKERDGAAI